MYNKLKLPLLGVLVVAAVFASGTMAYRYFGPEPTIPKPTMFSIADIASLEKSDPGALTDDQRRLLASIPENERQQLLTKKSFSLADLRPQKQ